MTMIEFSNHCFVQLQLEGEQIKRDHSREALIQTERKSHSVQNQLEETKTLLESADRQR